MNRYEESRSRNVRLRRWEASRASNDEHVTCIAETFYLTPCPAHASMRVYTRVEGAKLARDSRSSPRVATCSSLLSILACADSGMRGYRGMRFERSQASDARFSSDSSALDDA